MAQKANPELVRNLTPFFVRRGDAVIPILSQANVSSPPTDAELDAAFDTPANLPDPFLGIVDDNGAGTDVWLVLATNSVWTSVKLEVVPHGGWVYLASPLTSTSYDGDSYGTGDNGIIDLSSVFGTPGNIEAVLVRLVIKDASVGANVRLRPTSGVASTMVLYTQVANNFVSAHGIIPCDSNGDIYIEYSETIDEVYLQIWGYKV